MIGALVTLRIDSADATEHGPEAGVVSINLDPAVRGRGLAARLLQLLDVEARALGLRRLVAWIAAENVASDRAFASAGYADDGHHDLGGHAAIRRVRDLDG